ncbi:hypothetical protein QEN19_001842 [Hanseniaspora menglaensis]
MKLKPFDLVAAGHEGTLIDDSNMLFFKPSLPKEINFYSHIQSMNQQGLNLLIKTKNEFNEDIEPLNNWIPKYLGYMEEGIIAKDEKQQKTLTMEAKKIELPHLDDGIKVSTEKSVSKPYAVLENLLNCYKSPNIMDIKLGSVLYDLDASDDKKERLSELSSTTTSGSLGLRICGMKIKKFESVNYSQLLPFYHESTIDNLKNIKYISVGKQLGRSQSTLDQVKETLYLFASNHSLGDQWTYAILSNFLKRLELLMDTLKNTPVKLISSSILLVMETDEERVKKNSFEDVLIDDDYNLSSYIENYIDTEGENSLEEEGEGEGEEKIDIETLVQQMSLSKLKLIDFGHAEIIKTYKHSKFQADKNTLQGLNSLQKALELLISELYEQ